jgi:hypothetical protein
MTPTIGLDCHLILSHADIDAGAEYGFICPKDDSHRECGVQFVREVVSESTVETDTTKGTKLYCHFDLILADDLIAPNGAPHIRTRAQDYAKLLEFLSKPSGIALTSPAGTLVNLGSLGWSADERHMPHHSIIKVQLNNVGFYFPPADPDVLAASVWDGVYTWETSYWH